MRIYNNTNLVNKKFLNAVIAIGNFDGVHLGHQELLNKAYIFSRKLRKKFGIFTFDPLPKDFFNGTDNKILNISEKVDIVKKFGADFFIKQIFNRNFSKISREDFINKILFKRLKIHKSKVLVIGDNLNTDISGANNFNVKNLFIAGGIHKPEWSKKNISLANFVIEKNKYFKINYFQNELIW